MYKIGQAATLAGTTPRTLKWYEELELLPKGERTPGGFRLYDDHDVEVIQRIQKMQGLGLSLQAIREVLRHEADVDAMGRKRLPTAKLAEICDTLRAQRDTVQTQVTKLRDDLAAGEALLTRLERDLAVFETGLANRTTEETCLPSPTTPDA